MPEIRIFLAAGAVLASIGLTGCTSTGDSTSASLAMSSSADLTLPDTVAVVPTSFAPDPAAPAAFAETSEAKAAVTEVAFTPNAYAKADTASSDLDGLIAKYAAVYEVPVELVRRVVKRESNFRPAARNGPYWGLM